MKIFKFTLLLPASILCQVIWAQDIKNFTKASFGYQTMDQFFKVKSNVLPDNYSRTNIKSKGAIFLGFTHIISNRVLSGVSIGSTKITSSLVNSNQTIGILNRYLYTLAAESDFIYFKRSKFQLYGMAGFGYTFGKDEYFTDSGETDKGFVGFMAFQLSPLCIKYGTRIAAFAEPGFGYKAIVNVGFMYGF